MKKIFLTKKPTRFWKEITASFFFETKIHWSNTQVVFEKKMCVYTKRVNAMNAFPNA